VAGGGGRSGRDPGEGGALLANKRMLWLTRELGKARGVLVGDERLGKLELVQAAAMAGGSGTTRARGGGATFK
jgi:hypothetical protein